MFKYYHTATNVDTVCLPADIVENVIAPKMDTHSLLLLSMVTRETAIRVLKGLSAQDWVLNRAAEVLGDAKISDKWAERVRNCPAEKERQSGLRFILRACIEPAESVDADIVDLNDLCSHSRCVWSNRMDTMRDFYEGVDPCNTFMPDRLHQYAKQRVEPLSRDWLSATLVQAVTKWVSMRAGLKWHSICDLSTRDGMKRTSEALDVLISFALDVIAAAFSKAEQWLIVRGRETNRGPFIFRASVHGDARFESFAALTRTSAAARLLLSIRTELRLMADVPFKTLELVWAVALDDSLETRANCSSVEKYLHVRPGLITLAMDGILHMMERRENGFLPKDTLERRADKLMVHHEQDARLPRGYDVRRDPRTDVYGMRSCIGFGEGDRFSYW